MTYENAGSGRRAAVKGWEKMRTYESGRYLNSSENINIVYWDRDRSCDIHMHEFVELIFVVEGSCEHRIDEVVYEAEAGDLLFVNYGQTHAFSARTAEMQYYNLLYVPEFFSEELINSENIYDIFEISLFREFSEGEISPSQLVRFRGPEYLEIKKMIEDMYVEFREKRLGYRSVLNGYSRVLLSKILRKLKGAGADSVTQSYMNHLITECLAYIDARCFEKVTLKEIAEHTFYNPSYLSRIFREQCGISLSEYIKDRRIREAARLLSENHLSNEEVMHRVGYSDKKQFYKNFRDIYQVTPSEYRKNNPL